MSTMRPFPRYAFLLAAIFYTLALGGAPFAEERLIDTERSTITVRVSKSGPVWPAGGGYLIQVPLLEGSFDPSIPHMQLSIDARRMRVREDGLSAKERQEVQDRMLGPDVLDVDRFPFISFHSVEIQRLDGAEWLVQGELGLHGKVRATPVSVTPGHNRYKGSTTVRQSDYGIAPVTIAAGMVVLKDEIAIDFDIVIAEGRSP
jgi:polyisoprenoid-binding protein YceI